MQFSFTRSDRIRLRYPALGSIPLIDTTRELDYLVFAGFRCRKSLADLQKLFSEGHSAVLANR